MEQSDGARKCNVRAAHDEHLTLHTPQIGECVTRCEASAINQLTGNVSTKAHAPLTQSLIQSRES
ncbi:hypothetical protein SAMN05444149_1098 [Pseudosulfitobacter pseudonitzschiae]|uniref:Uncharacterized protein n=1 Tax=Pseudosulfitobacter pseudonitzschiae TaxID=1402135 RepID=A0A073IXC4_9RHOB|nr:hypothetical protein SUH3_07800 [Pseudosulfitobacter pseudonitzschiae]SHG04705.1 hypothetical protein SAMN05444149_1098 [Pseudosulfitobacter pseudonitzschiae]